MLKPTALRVRLARSAAVVILVALPVSTGAATRPSKGGFPDDEKRIVDAIALSNKTLPAVLHSRKDVYVLVTAGAAYTDVVMLARSTVPPERLAGDLERSVDGTEWSGVTVEWSQDGEYYSAARFTLSRPRFGARRMEMRLPLGALLQGLGRAGYRPHAVLRVARTAVATGTRPALNFRRNAYTREVFGDVVFYDANGWPPAKVVETSGALSLSGLALTGILYLVLPVAMLIGAILALVLGTRRGIPVERRRRLFLALANKFTLWVFLLLGPAVLGYRYSSYAARIGDLWFGDPFLDGPVWVFLYGPGLLGLLILVPLALLEVRLFGPAREERLPKPEPTREERASERWAYAGCAAQALGVALMLLGVGAFPGWKPSGFPFHVLGILLFLGVSMAFLLMSSRRSRSLVHVDEGLTRRAVDIAKRLEVPVREVQVDERVIARRNANAFMLAHGRIKVTRGLVDVASPEEMDFILAHELAHAQHRDHWSRWLLAVPVLLCAWFPMLSSTIGKHLWADAPWVPFALFALPALALLSSAFFLQPHNRRQEYEADRTALGVTGNLSAAQSALRKLARRSDLPYLHDADDLTSHPKLSKRLDALCRAAEEMRLLETRDTVDPTT